MMKVMLRGVSARLYDFKSLRPGRGCVSASCAWMVIAALGICVLTFGHASVARAGVILQSATFNGNTYYLVGNSGGAGITFTDAESYAQTLGGHLATINSLSENNFVTNTFAPLTSSNVGGLWIGLNDRAVENTYVWTSGQSSSYRNFAPGEPSHSPVDPSVFPDGIPEDPGETVENYVFIYGNDGSTDRSLRGEWDDYFDIDNIYQFSGAPLYGVVEVNGIASPEPTSLTLFGIGALGLMGHGWRRKRKAVLVTA